MTKKGKRTALLQRTEEIAELRRENEQLRARLAAPEQTDEKLRQSEERYRLLADNASDVIWITDMDLNLTYVSPSAARMLGCSMNELMTSAVSDLLLPESVRLRIQAFREQISSGPRLLGRSARELTLETRLQLRDGMRIWVEQRIDFIRGDGDRLTGVMGITREITDRKEAEEELRTSEERSRLLLDNANEGIAVVQNGVLKFANPRLAELSGYSVQELISKPLAQLIYPDDVPMVMDRYAGRLRGEELPDLYTARFIDKKGNTVWGEINAVLFEWEGSPAVLALIGDITERQQAQEALKASEERFRTLIEKAADVVVVLGADGKTKYQSPSLQRVTGYAPQEWVNRSWTEFFIHPDDMPILSTSLEQVLARPGAAVENMCVSYQHKDGSWRILEGTLTNMLHDPKVNGLVANFRDITERKLVEEALKESEDRFRLLFERSAEAQLLLDREGKVVDCNDAMLRLFALCDKKEIVGHDPEEFAPEFQPDGTPSSDMGTTILATVLDKGSAQFEWAHLKHDPQRTPIMNELICTLIPIQGRPFLHVAIRDVTERKRAEDSLRESEKRYRLIAENSSDVIWTMDMNLRNTFLSPSITKLTGYSFEEAFSMRMEDSLTPDSLERASQSFLEGMRALERNEAPPGASSRVELEMKCKDGSTVWVETETSFMRNSDGEVVGIMGVARNIDDRRRAQKAREESEERYRLLAENATDLIFTTDMNLKYTYISPAVESLTGYAASEYMARSLEESLTPESYDMVSTIALEEIATEESGATDRNRSQKAEAEVRRKDGTTVWVEIQASFLRDAGGKAVGIVGVSRDITERKRAEEALRESEKRLKEAQILGRIGNWEYNTSSNTTIWSDEIYRLYDRDPALGPPAWEEQVSYYLPEQQERLMEAGRKAADTGQEFAQDLEAILPSGRRAYFQTTMRPIQDAKGQVVKVIGTVQDITERKKAEKDLQRAHAELESRVEQRTAELQEANALLLREIRQRQEAQERLQESESKYRELVESANSVILELDTKGKVSFFNRFAQEFFGFPESEIIGRHVVGTIAPPVDSKGKDGKTLIQELIKHPQEHLVTESEGVRRNGERVWISWTNKGLYDAKGRLRNVLCIGMDRTEQKRVAEMLAEQVKEKAAVDERQRLARDLHDAVTQTLFSASLIAEVLPRLWKKDHAEGERRLEELRRLTRGALAEMRMLLLELRPGALGEVGLADLLRQLAEATTGQTRLAIDVVLRGKCDVPTNVQVAFYRVAQEALNNMLKHSGATEAGIRLHCRKGSVDLAISDNGSGFDLEKVSPKSLGLRIMRERAEAVGATLKIDGGVGRGTEIRALWSDAQRKGDS